MHQSSVCWLPRPFRCGRIVHRRSPNPTGYLSVTRLYYACLIVIAAYLIGCSNDSANSDHRARDNEQAAPPAAELLAETEVIEEPPIAAAESDSAAELKEFLPEEVVRLWEPWHGDLPGMIERRAIRVVVPFGGYQFYYDRGKPRGAIIELLGHLETFLNKELGRRHVRVYIVPIPLSRDLLLPSLLQGNADLVAADLTITDIRDEQVTFTRPLLKKISEVVVTGPASPGLNTVTDLSGKEIVVRESSSYYEHLQSLAQQFEKDGMAPLTIRNADELLEAEDLLEMLNAGLIPLTVMDDYKAMYWADVFPDLVVREDLAINKNGEIAWAMRNENPELAALVKKFLRKYGKGTLVGNDTFNRYLANADRVRCATSLESIQMYPELAGSLQKYAEMYGYDWLMLAAQGFQESGLRQDRRSPVGAIGIMQVKPTTAADRNVAISGIEEQDNNIHAGAKYMRFLADRYFSDDVDALNQWFFALAAYNAGPARVAKLRSEAARNGYDRNRWFGNVEIIAARRIGAETVGYVSSIYKYFVGYQLAITRRAEKRERFGTELGGCAAEFNDSLSDPAAL